MSTIREVVSLIRTEMRMLSTDGQITNRVIASELKNSASLLIKRELNLRKLTATDTIYTTIPCLEMVQVPLSECCDYVDPVKISRSKHKLPRIGESNYLYAIQGVFSINQKVKLKEITPTRYINLLKLPTRAKENYYWIQNDYLYVTNADVTTVKLIAYFEEDVPNEIMYPECDCAANTVSEDYCKNPLDGEFKCPGYLLKQVTDLTKDTLLKTYFQVKEDNASDGEDAQAPNNR